MAFGVERKYKQALKHQKNSWRGANMRIYTFVHTYIHICVCNLYKACKDMRVGCVEQQELVKSRWKCAAARKLEHNWQCRCVACGMWHATIKFYFFVVAYALNATWKRQEDAKKYGLHTHENVFQIGNILCVRTIMSFTLPQNKHISVLLPSIDGVVHKLAVERGRH